MKRLKMQPGSSEPVCHGTESYAVSNVDWTVLVPDHVAGFMLEDGRSGCVLVEDPHDHPQAVTCPHCGRIFVPSAKE